MASKNDENFIAFCDELRAYVEEHHLFPQKHSRLSHKIKYTRKKIKAGTAEDWMVEKFNEILAMRTKEHTGGKRKKSVPDNNTSQNQDNSINNYPNIDAPQN